MILAVKYLCLHADQTTVQHWVTPGRNTAKHVLRTCILFVTEIRRFNNLSNGMTRRCTESIGDAFSLIVNYLKSNRLLEQSMKSSPGHTQQLL